MERTKRAKQLTRGAKPKRVPYRPRPPRTWKIKSMPRDLKEKFDKVLHDGTMQTSLQLAKWLGDNGFEISRRAVDDYRSNFERRLDSVRLASEQARIVCEQFKDDDAQMQSALMRLVQTQLFEVLAAVKQPPKGRAARSGAAQRGGATIAPVNITALARSVSGLAKAETEHRRWAERARAGVAEVEKKVEEARAKGLSKDAADQIKAVLMEI